GVQLRYRTAVTGVRVEAHRVVAVLAGGEEVAGAALVGADGAHSAVRSGLGIAFTGETYPMRYLTVACPVEFDALLPGLAPVSYVSGGGEGVGLLALRDHWRAVFRVPPGEPDAEALSAGAIARRLAGVLPAASGPYPVVDAFIYRVHRRVAATFRRGRVLLVGDAAHVNSPSGGMGMNSGIHDAYLAARALAAVLTGDAGEDVLDRYATDRRRVARDVVGSRSDRNYRDIVQTNLAARQRRRDELAAIAADPTATLRYLRQMSMLDTAPTLGPWPRASAR
ncbi:MAG TPA: FAD-dependent monooxygenase, partial [Mycobacteriales bacterium]|nr:FAD-dependent monooxygenase [Mycobacteriales bacterium]